LFRTRQRRASCHSGLLRHGLRICPAVRLSVGLNDANFQKAAPASDPSKHVVRLNFRFTLSLRDVEKMLAQRGIEVSYETIRCAVNALPS